MKSLVQMSKECVKLTPNNHSQLTFKCSKRLIISPITHTQIQARKHVARDEILQQFKGCQKKQVTKLFTEFSRVLSHNRFHLPTLKQLFQEVTQYFRCKIVGRQTSTLFRVHNYWSRMETGQLTLTDTNGQGTHWAITNPKQNLTHHNHHFPLQTINNLSPQ